MIGNKSKFSELSLFPKKANLAINGSNLALARITDAGKVPESAFDSFSDLLLESENLYPGIDVWFKKKVVPGLQSGKRVAYVLFHEGKAIAECVVKFGTDTKICSMRVDPLYQKKGIGPFLFAQVARELDYSIKTIHFTAPESLVLERNGLFEDLGFIFQGKSKQKYRLGMDELVFRGDAKSFIRSTAELIAKKTTTSILGGSIPGTLLSIKPKYIEKIFLGEKIIELRRKFSIRNKGNVALLYATSPICKILGDALIENIVVDSPLKIWKEFHYFTGCSKFEFDEYSKGCNTMSAIFLKKICRYPHPFDWDNVMKAFVGIKKPPQSHLSIPLATLSFWGTLASAGDGIEITKSNSKNINQISLGF